MVREDLKEAQRDQLVERHALRAIDATSRANSKNPDDAWN